MCGLPSKQVAHNKAVTRFLKEAAKGGVNMVSLDRLMPLDDDMSAEEFSELVKLTRAHGEIDFSKVNPKAEHAKKQKNDLQR